MDINLSIPVAVFDYKESENPLYSIAKLKIFYVGMTPDKRLFTKEFSDNLLKTLPYVPVVGFYDKDDEDFKGHNKNQYIYGVVPESTELDYKEMDGNKYAICDVILYTGRKDETGEIAQKIVGKPHSLELNPDDVTYEVHKNAEGNIEAIEFKTGSLLGLSVLGDDQQPAFTGSEFFKLQKDLTDIIKGFNTEWEKYNESTERGNEEMEFDLFKEQASFIERTYNEKLKLMQRFLSVVYDYFYINELYEEYVVVTVFDEETWETNMFRLSYSSEGDTISFTNEVQVFPRYLTEEEITTWENSMKTQTQDGIFEDESSEPGAESTDNEQDENFENDVEDNEEENNEDNFVEENENNEEEEEEEDTFEDNDPEQQEGEQDEQESEEDEFEEEEQHEEEQEEGEEEFSSTSLDSGEREELEALRREKKFGLIASFEGDLSKDFIKEIIKKVDNYSYEELENELSKEFTRIKKEEEIKRNTVINPLLISATKKSQDRKSVIKSLVEHYKD